jgi:hypothetical protein
VQDPLQALRNYAARTKTVSQFDLAGTGDPEVLTAEEIARTRIISSRISRREASWLLQRSINAPWSHVPADADLRLADPARRNELYDAMTQLYNHFRHEAPRGVATAKVSKVLHLKRPALFPLLDSHVTRVYRKPARAHARLHPDRCASHLYWAAIRSDLIAASDGGILDELRQQLADDSATAVRKLGNLTDLRLLDICAW